MKINIVRGSVLDQGADVIVNAANTLMRGGGGIDGRVHQLAGPKLLLALQRVAPRGAEVAEAVVTPGFNLPAKWIVHVAGPIWRGGDQGEGEQLAACYRNALLAADKTESESVAFCSISTGTFGFPLDLAAPIALRSLAETGHELHHIKKLTVALFGQEEFQVFSRHSSDVQR